MKEWVPESSDGTVWAYGDSLLYRSTCDGGWAGSLRGYSVVYDKTMAVAARRLMTMEDFLEEPGVRVYALLDHGEFWSIRSADQVFDDERLWVASVKAPSLEEAAKIALCPACGRGDMDCFFCARKP